MPTTQTPVWSAPHNGILGDASATAGAGQVNQFLGTHAEEYVYEGNAVLTPGTSLGLVQAGVQLLTQDVDQPFPLSGTAVGRVTVPVLAVGQGADLLVSLCTDNGSGRPGTLVCQTRIPASWITNLSAVTSASVPLGEQPVTQYTGSLIATPQSNQLINGTVTAGTWSAPIVNNATLGSSMTCYYDAGGSAFLVVAGGYNTTTSSVTAGVYTAEFDAEGTITASTPQPSLPVAASNGSVIVVTEADGTTLTLVQVGGIIGTGGTTFTNAVYTASFNAATGVVGAWSAQTAFATTISESGIATANGFVYVVAGQNASAFKTVWYAKVSNGQISAWTAATPIPWPSAYPSAAVIDGFLFVWGIGATMNVDSIYAPINADGSLGSWQPGPTPVFLAVGQALTLGSWGVMNQNVQPITATADGPGLVSNEATVLGQYTGMIGSCAAGAGQWQIVAANYSNTYGAGVTYLEPMISVPLPATGLTNGATYHVLMQQRGGDLNDYLLLATDSEIIYTGLSTYPTLLTSGPNAYAWSADPVATTAVPINVYDNTPPAGAAPAVPLHMWEDQGARVTTLVNTTTPDMSLLGLCEATRKAVALNQNSGFETGIAPWTCTGGTVAQSSTEVFEGRFSAQVTPGGVASVVFLQSELLPCMPGQSVTVDGRMRFTNAVTSNVSMSVNWWGPTGSFISTSSNNVTFPRVAGGSGSCGD